MNYSHITPEAGMVMKKPPVMIPLSGRVPGRASEPPELGFAMTAAADVFWRKGSVI
jgi:hypothetical protein